MSAAISPTKAFHDLDQVVRQVDDVSSLPNAVAHIIAITQNPLADVRDLSHAVSVDPAIAARLMRCVNSVAVGLRHPIQTLEKAISYLGYSQVRSLAITAAMSGVFRQSFSIGRYHRAGLWRHMASVGLTARTIATHMRHPNPDEVFLAGLLHDLGIILEDQYLHDRFAAMMREAPLGISQVDLEREHLGFDHALLGGCVAEKWALPEGVRETIRYHHATRYNGPYAKTIACVELANVLVTARGSASTGQSLPQMSASVVEHLGIGRAHVRPIIDLMNHQLDRQETLLRLPAVA